MSPDGQPCVLITIPISHYCEKARWALDRAGAGYREQALSAAQRLASRAASRRPGRTAPVHGCGHRVLADSPEIVDEADGKAPPGQRLYPPDPKPPLRFATCNATSTRSWDPMD